MTDRHRNLTYDNFKAVPCGDCKALIPPGNRVYACGPLAPICSSCVCVESAPALKAKFTAERARVDGNVIPIRAGIEVPKPTGLAAAIAWGGWDAPLAAFAWVLDGLIIENRIHMIHADAGSIKTWVAISAAIAVATGMPWLGIHAVRKSPTLYLDYEDGRDEFHRRVQLLGGGATVPDLGYAYHAGRIDEPSFWLDLATVVKAKSIGFVVLDTLSGGQVGTDENDARAATALELAGPFCEATNAAVLVLHHSNKSGDIRGTSAFKGKVDTLYKITNESVGQDRHRAKLTCEKSNAKHTRPLWLEFSDDGLTTYEPPSDEPEDGDRVTANAADAMTAEELSARVLLAIEAGPLGSIEKIRQITGGKAARVRAELAELQAKGHVAKTKAGYVIDSEAKRLARVDASAERYEYWKSPAALAEDAAVPRDFCEELIRQGILVPRSAEGGGFFFRPK